METELVSMTPQQREAAWNLAIAKAKSMVTVKSDNQMMIAELALGVCEISWGGTQKHRNEKYTLVRFAKEVGVDNRTLSQWVGVFLRAYRKLPSGKAKHLSFTKLSAIAVKVHKDATKAEVAKAFDEVVNVDSFDNKMQRYLCDLKSISYNFEQKNAATKCSEKTLQEILFFCKVISRAILREHKGMKPACSDLFHDANTHKRIGAAVALGVPTRRGDVVSDGIGGIVRLTPKDRDVLNFMKQQGKWLTPTEIGIKVHKASKDSASGWALRTLNKFRGSSIERNDKGHYRWVG